MTAITVDHLTKIYHLYDSPSARLKEALHPFRKKYHHDFYALNDVSFNVEQGEVLGIIGKNGCGKSTLLKILAGVLTPTSGTVTINGNVSALLELGSGFNPEFTGLENVYFSSAIMGYSREQVEQHLDEILAFADIGEFIYQPVKTYSSGMYVRLAFAVSVNVQPDIFIVDEALAVGDMAFQMKCMLKMKSMLDLGTTVLLVSHDINTIRSLCNKTLWIDRGQIKQIGDSAIITKNYEMELLREKQNEICKRREVKNSTNQEYVMAENNTQFEKDAYFQRYRTGKSEFFNVLLLNEQGESIKIVEFDQLVTLRMGIKIIQDLPIISCGYNIFNRNGIDIIGTNFIIENTFISDAKAGERYMIDFTFRIPLREGAYNILVSHSVPVDHHSLEVDVCDRIPYAYQFEVKRKHKLPIPSAVKIHNRINIHKINNYK